MTFDIDLNGLFLSILDIYIYIYTHTFIIKKNTTFENFKDVYFKDVYFRLISKRPVGYSVLEMVSHVCTG